MKHLEWGLPLRKLSINVSCYLTAPTAQVQGRALSQPTLPHPAPPCPSCPIPPGSDTMQTRQSTLETTGLSRARETSLPASNHLSTSPSAPSPSPHQLEASHRASHQTPAFSVPVERPSEELEISKNAFQPQHPVFSCSVCKHGPAGMLRSPPLPSTPVLLGLKSCFSAFHALPALGLLGMKKPRELITGRGGRGCSPLRLPLP